MTAIDPSTRAYRLVRPLPPYEPSESVAPASVQLALAPDPPPASTPDPQPAAPTLEQSAARLGAHIVLRLLVEVIDGRRPVAQLTGAVSGPVLRYVTAASRAMNTAASRTTNSAVSRTGAHPRRRCAAGRLRSLRLTQPRDGVAEVSAVCQLGGRIRAMAARIEQLDDDAPLGWRCTALRLG